MRERELPTWPEMVGQALASLNEARSALSGAVLIAVVAGSWLAGAA